MLAQWLAISPLDTLFFRGGEPMEAGETHEAGRPVFPPMPETIIGALRTGILAQRGIAPARVRHLEEDQDLDQEHLPFWGTPRRPGFRIAGPLLRAHGVDLFPAPANWFYDGTPEKEISHTRICVYEAQPVATPPVKLPQNPVLWVANPPEDLEPLSGQFWLTRRALENEGRFELELVCETEKLAAEKAQAIPVKLLITTEERIGLARDNACRTAVKGHLYAARHLRLAQGVSLLVGLDKPLCPSHLDARGTFQLGGEGRLVRYGLLPEEKAPRLPGPRAGRLLAISPLAYSRAEAAGLLKGPYASGKLFRVAGWDMKKAFHKPTKSYFPVGAVFFAKRDSGLCEVISF